MNITTFDVENDFIDGNKLTKEAAANLTSLISKLQAYLPSDGYVQSSVDNSVIKRMEVAPADTKLNPKYSQPKLVHDKTNNEYRLNDLKGKFKAIATKSTDINYASTAWVNPTTGVLTAHAINFLNQFVEGSN